jgi:hypothetical protein
MQLMLPMSNVTIGTFQQRMGRPRTGNAQNGANDDIIGCEDVGTVEHSTGNTKSGVQWIRRRHQPYKYAGSTATGYGVASIVRNTNHISHKGAAPH